MNEEDLPLPLWKEIDSDFDSCELIRTSDPKVYQFTITEGPFSGYPLVNVTIGSLYRLYKILDKEFEQVNEEFEW